MTDTTLTTGTKFDGGKARPDLLNWDLIQELENILPVTYHDGEALRRTVWRLMHTLSRWAACSPKDPLAQKFWAFQLSDAFDVLAALLPRPPASILKPYNIRAAAAFEVAKVLAFGAGKYAPRNWEKGIRYSRVYASALRHGHAFLSGEDYDPETGLLHMAHFACNIMFLATYSSRGMDGGSFDDRGE